MPYCSPFQSRESEGEVVAVDRGRVVHVRFKDGDVLACCRPILDLVEAATEVHEEEGITLEQTHQFTLVKGECTPVPYF